MGIHFNSVISLEKLFDTMVGLGLSDEVVFYIQYWNQERKFYLKKINPQKFTLDDFKTPSYMGFFFISNNVDLATSDSPYADGLF